MSAEREARGKEDRLGAKRQWQAGIEDHLLKYVKDDLQWDKDLRTAMEKQTTYGTAQWKPGTPPVFGDEHRLFKGAMPPFGKSIMFKPGKAELDAIMAELARSKPGGIFEVYGELKSYDMTAFDDGPSREERLLLLCK